ncbi:MULTISPECIES: hypothetical protein [unclassified Mycobacterium]|uniref:hypothetical protein n=1 Tax=unclassified Mycobacterium TaxID=2642494 RepID=UPI0029C75BC1|nr:MULTISPECIES: hypothetical protein [unclassified Mycobacterium]
MIPNTRTRCAAAAIVIGATTAITFPAASTAAPEWNIGAYDRCMQGVQDAIADGNIAQGNEVDAYRECCERTGGVYSDNGKGFAECHTASDPKPYTPGRLPSHTLTPVNPLHPGNVTQDITQTP